MGRKHPDATDLVAVNRFPVKAVKKYVGTSIKKYRTEAGMTQSKLAEAVGLSRTTLTHIENGEDHISVYKLVMIAAVLNMPVDLLLPTTPRGKT